VVCVSEWVVRVVLVQRILVMVRKLKGWIHKSWILFNCNIILMLETID
jgi:hypothetical protein